MEEILCPLILINMVLKYGTKYTGNRGVKFRGFVPLGSKMARIETESAGGPCLGIRLIRGFV